MSLGDRVIIPIREGGNPCWNFEIFDGEKIGYSRGTVFNVNDSTFSVEFTDAYGQMIKWNFYHRHLITNNLDKLESTYPYILSDKFDVVYKVVFSHKQISKEDSEKAKEEAASFVRRNFRSWPLNKELMGVFLSEDSKTAIEFYFSPISDNEV
jgi:hypothetical protein